MHHQAQIHLRIQQFDDLNSIHNLITISFACLRVVLSSPEAVTFVTQRCHLIRYTLNGLTAAQLA